MSNVNQAFLRAYSKERRKSQAGTPREDRIVGRTFETSSTDEASSIQYHRVNTGGESAEIPTPWISSVEVVGILPTPEVRTRKPDLQLANKQRSSALAGSASLPTNDSSPEQSQNRSMAPNPVSSQSSMEPRLDASHSVPKNHFDRFAKRQEAGSNSTIMPTDSDAPVRSTERLAKETTTLRDYIDRGRGAAIRFSEAEDDPDASVEASAWNKQRQKEIRWEEEHRARLAEAQLRAIQRQNNSIASKVQEVHPVWEVDRFYWPEITDRLLQEESLSFQQIGNHLISSSDDGLRTLAVTSARAGTGRTTVAMCLARIAAKAGLRVALVDADVNHPALADQLNIEFAHGWEEHVTNGVPLDECAIQSVDEGLTIFPCKVDLQPLNLALDHPKIRDMIGQLAGNFDLVILDCNHLGVAGGKLLGSGRDGTIDAATLVVDGTSERHDIIDYAVERLQQIGIRSVGLIENGII